MKRLAVIAASLLALLPARNAAAEQVHCYDPGRNFVSYVGREACRYEIITPERAKEIRDARRDYIRRSMQQPSRAADQAKYRSFGSGFFVYPDGHVVTNHHVVARCNGLSVLTAQGAEIPARLVAVSPRMDLALLRTDTPVGSFASISQAGLSPDEPLTIIGFPVLKLPRREPMIMHGRFLGEHQLSNKGDIMAIDALVWKGSSGSPAFNRYGQVVGVVFAKANIPAIYQRSGVVADDRTYAVPAQELTLFLTRNGVIPFTARPDGKSADPAETLVRINCLN